MSGTPSNPEEANNGTEGPSFEEAVVADIIATTLKVDAQDEMPATESPTKEPSSNGHVSVALSTEEVQEIRKFLSMNYDMLQQVMTKMPTVTGAAAGSGEAVEKSPELQNVRQQLETVTAQRDRVVEALRQMGTNMAVMMEQNNLKVASQDSEIARLRQQLEHCTCGAKDMNEMLDQMPTPAKPLKTPSAGHAESSLDELIEWVDSTTRDSNELSHMLSANIDGARPATQRGR